MHPADVTPDDLDRRPHEVWAALREHGPVVWVEAVGGWVVLGRHEAIEVLRDARTFTVDDPRFSTSQVIGPSMLGLDGDEQLRHRSPFAAAFRPAEVTRRFADSATELARGLLEPIVCLGRADLRERLAGPLAVAVVAASLGLEEVAPGELLDWYGAIVAAVERISFGTEPGPAAAEAFGRLGDAVLGVAGRAGGVLHGAASVLAPDEVVANAAVCLFGGIETSEGMTAHALRHVLAHPGVLAALRADRTAVDAAVEESLRLEPAATRVDRYATADRELAGAAVRAGDLVVVSLAAANRDPSVYERPDDFVLDRSEARTHLAFAQGPHACLGAQLARLETRAAVEAVLDLLPGVELDGPVPACAGAVFRKPVSVPARWGRSAERSFGSRTEWTS